eukprot:285156_1
MRVQNGKPHVQNSLHHQCSEQFTSPISSGFLLSHVEFMVICLYSIITNKTIYSLIQCRYLLVMLIYGYILNVSRSLDYSPWIKVTSPHLPRETSRIALGYDSASDTIWLIGGSYPNNRQLIAFKNNTFIDYGQYYFPYRIDSADYQRMYFKQINNIVWMHDTNDQLIKFNVKTLQIEYNYNSMVIGHDNRQAICLESISANNNDYLVTIGGLNYINGTWHYLNTVKIFNFSSNEWLSNVPYMQRNRSGPACAINNEQLYVISDGTSIEMLYIGDLQNINAQKWEYIDDLLFSVASPLAVKYDDDIIVYGVFDTEFNIINTITNTIRLGGPFDYWAQGQMPIVVYPDIYLFGGFINSYGHINTWQYYSAQTNNSIIMTTLPSTNSTFNPIKNTLTPTITSIDPTMNPTTNPSLSSSLDYSPWIKVTSPHLPRKAHRIALGYDSANDTIWLIGGTYPNDRQLIAFKNNTFIDYGQYYFPYRIQSAASLRMHFTQINNIVWMHDTNDQLVKFNVKTLQIEYNYNSMVIGQDNRESICLESISANNNDYLITIGGANYINGSWYYLNTVKIFNFSSNEWLSNVPYMQHLRSGPACAISNEQLYAIAGRGGGISIEMLYIGDIQNVNSQKWEYIDDLLFSVASPLAVKYDDDIIVYGVFDTEFNIINTITNTIRLGGPFDYWAQGQMPIVAYPDMYLFGGFINSYGEIDTWQYYTAQTENSTFQSPTTIPPNEPTFNPTKNTLIPTFNPTIPPTEIPTYMSSTNPTTNYPSATLLPTLLPTSKHTISPTTGNPTVSPSSYLTNTLTTPSNDPTEDPSVTPSINTTFNPSINNNTTIFTSVNPTHNPSGPPVVIIVSKMNPTVSSHNPTNTTQPVSTHNVDTNRNWLSKTLGLDDKETLIIIVVTSSIVICLVIFIIVCTIRKSNSLQHKNEFISNALAVVITIGEYDDLSTIKDPDFSGYVSPLPEIEKDSKNLKELFSLLNYRMFPGNWNKMHWTQDELKLLFEEKITNELLDENSELQYDGLIVCISSHGIDRNIITSDYHTIETSAIHRYVSHKNEIRAIPRMFIFDSCQGNLDRQKSDDLEQKYDQNVVDESDEKMAMVNIVENDNDKSKAIGVEDTNTVWTTSAMNPDYKLIEIHSANTQFQAKCSTHCGSYLIYHFTKKIKENVINHTEKTLAEIFDEIQNLLHNQGKQQITKSFNNETGNLQFKINNNPHTKSNSSKMIRKLKRNLSSTHSHGYETVELSN